MCSEIAAPTHTGTLYVPSTRSLQHFCTETTQVLLQPGYFDQHATWYRLISLAGKLVTIAVSADGWVRWSCQDAIESTRVQEMLHHLLVSLPLPEAAQAALPPELAARFRSLHPLVHIASVSLGEALLKAIIRQVITASHARKLTSAFIRRYGKRQVYDGVTYYDFPSIEVVAKISLEELQAEGFGFKAKVLHRTAQLLLENDLETAVAQVSPAEALALLTSIPGIGRWTAQITLCDWRADWSLYPFEDLAVRTWAKKLWTGVSWPQDERQFAACWQQINGGYTGIITCYLLSCAATQH
ncbi:MAG TPA: hypothetical protein VFV38_39105, partial [Ktedonobacteraceae bacterium]|nr:hypothetical protein [Ktedonobacteraceae bacterium]